VYCVGGVSFEDDINMEEEILVSVEEQLQSSLDSLRDDVIKQHSDIQMSPAAGSCVLFQLFQPLALHHHRHEYEVL